MGGIEVLLGRLEAIVGRLAAILGRLGAILGASDAKPGVGDSDPQTGIYGNLFTAPWPPPQELPKGSSKKEKDLTRPGPEGPAN